MPRILNGRLIRQGTGQRGEPKGWVKLPVEGESRLEFLEELSRVTRKSPGQLCREILAEAIDERSRILRGSLALTPLEV